MLPRLAVLSLLLTTPALAATYNVNNTADSGSNSLRDAISSATVGANTIAWGAGSGGAITLATDLPTVADQTTLDVSAAPSSVTIAGSNVVLGGLATFNNTSVAQPWTISSAIIGVGSMTKTGAGTLILNGANSFSGGSTINGGTVIINNAAGLGSGPVTLNGTTLQTSSTLTFTNSIVLIAATQSSIDTLGNTAIFSGVISGGGTLVNASTGTLILTGNNTHTGGTLLNSGVFSYGSENALGTGSLTFNGGTLKVTFAHSTTHTWSMSAGGGTIDTNGYDVLVPIGITGAGALTKIGEGTLILGGGNSNAGATTVNAGTIRLAVDNAVANASALTVGSAGTFDMATFQNTVASLSSAGTIRMALPGTGLPRLTVTGNRNITGGTLVLTFVPGTLVTSGQQYTIMTSGSSSGAGFTSVISPAAVTFTPTYTATDVKITASFVPFATSAANGNQSAIATSLEAMRANTTGDSASVLSALYNLDSTQLQQALDQLGPVSLAGMQGVGQAGASLQSAAVAQRAAAIADGTAGSGFSSYAVNTRSLYPGTLVATTLGDDNMTATHGGASLDLSSPWGYFASLSGTTGRLIETHGPSGTQPGYAFNSGGLTMGADYRHDEIFTTGVSAGFLRGHAGMYAPASGTIDNNSFRLGGYGTANNANFHANGYLGGALDFFKTNRGINFPGISRTATASPLGKELSANANVSYDLPTNDWGIYSPFAGLSYNRLMIGAFTEDGADSLDLAVDPQTAQSLQSNLGVKVSRRWATDERTVIPYFSVGWLHELRGQSRPISARFATGAGAPFSVATGDYAVDGTAVGAGVSSTFGKNATARLDWAGDFRSHFVSSTVTLDLKLRY